MKTHGGLPNNILITALLILLAGNGTFSTSNDPAGSGRFHSPDGEREYHLELSFEYVDQPYSEQCVNISFNPPHERKMAYQNPVIISQGKVSVEFLTEFLLQHNTNLSRDYACQITNLYVEEAEAEGVNHDIAFCQMCLETGFLKYGGVVKPVQFNFCGLGAVSDFIEGEYFDSPAEGIRAHIQHLKAYATDDPLKHALIDRRFDYVKRGSANQIDELTGKWATDPHYGKKIRYLLRRLHRSV